MCLVTVRLEFLAVMANLWHAFHSGLFITERSRRIAIPGLRDDMKGT